MSLFNNALKFFSLNKGKGAHFFLSSLSPDKLFNYLLLFLCKKKFKTHVPWRPIGIVAFVNNECNMECTFCGRNNGFLKKALPEGIKDMSPVQLKKIFNRMNEVRHVAFCGTGEPLLNKDLFEMIELSHEYGKETTLYTNGILINHQNIEKLLAHNLSSLVISMKGADEKEFFSNTGLGEKTFSLILNNISNVVTKKREHKHPISICLHHICSRDKMHNMIKMVELANTLHADHLCFNVLVDLYPARVTNRHAFFDSDKEVIDMFKNLTKKAEMPLKLPPLVKKHNNYNCSAASGFLMIDGQGNVSPCCRIPPKEKFGNIFTDKNVLNNKTFVFTRRATRTRPMPSCLVCHCLSAA